MNYHSNDSIQGEESAIDKLAKVEGQAQRVLEAITNCINSIKKVGSFQPPVVKSLLDPTEATGVTKRRNPAQDSQNGQLVYLFRILESNGLLGEIQATCNFHSSIIQSEDDDSYDDNDYSHYHPMENDRQKFVYKILIPLLESLTYIFHVLDDDSANTNYSPLEANQDFEHTSISRRRKKPDAPRGLLSLSNYTDIACLLELTVCTAILPLLENHVQSPVIERTKYLPKSIAGRLNRKSLHWGVDTLKNKQPTCGKILSVDLKKRQERAAMKIDRASKELSDVIVAMSKLLLLDRFKPMLLPRHASDIYSGLFQFERLRNLRERFDFPVLSCYCLKKMEIPLSSIKRIFLFSSICDEEISTSVLQTSAIDLTTMVRSYQTLLLSGKHAPSWLKARISGLLTDLAVNSTDGLQAIIDVFVVAASSLPTEQISGASSRLGSVLCAKPTGSKSSGRYYYKALLNQFMTLLTFKDLDLSNLGENVEKRVAAIVLTTWSVLDNLPKEITHTLFYRSLIEGFFPSSSSNSDQSFTLQSSIRCIHALLLFLPSGGKAVKEFCLALVSHIDLDFCQGIDAPGSISVLGQLLRIVSARGETLFMSNEVKEAKEMINLIVYTMLLKWNHTEHMHGDKILAISLLKSLAMNPLDKLGYFFDLRSSEKDGCDLVHSTSEIDLPVALLTDMEKRAKFIITDIIPQEEQEVEAGGDGSFIHNLQCFTSTFFKLQIILYFEPSKSSHCLPDSIVYFIDEYKIVSMMLLPLLCEKCPLGILLTERESKSNDILRMISLIIVSTSKIFQHNNDSITMASAVLDPTCPSRDFAQYDDEVNAFLAKPSRNAQHEGVLTIQMNIESQLSITSVIISLLIAILELGSSKRAEEEENNLKLLVPSLIILSKLGDLQSIKANREGRVLENETDLPAVNILKSEIAEMASHAAVMIQARSLKDLPKQNDNLAGISLVDYTKQKIEEIKRQLASDQPPLRAHAIAILRKLTQGILKRPSIPNLDIAQKNPLVVEIGTGANVGVSADSETEIEGLANEILRICIDSLEDQESYVYLASIQTLVAMIDENPSHFMPIIIDCVTTGHLNLVSQEKDRCFQLSSTQRIKMIEVVNFIIRRRGSTIQNFSALLLNAILYGQKNFGDSVAKEDDFVQKMIQVQTESYFRGDGKTEYEEESDKSEQHFRLRTGGPVFDTEEDDVIRAACISIVAEVVSALHPSTLTPFCATLVQLGRNALLLDHSRSVRRSAALLCRELYNCALRETTAQEDRKSQGARFDFTLALLSNDEGKLHETLQRSLTANDLDIVKEDDVLRSVRGKTRLFDSAVVARCEEALDARHELEDLGIIEAGAIILQAQANDESCAVAKFLSRELKKI